MSKKKVYYIKHYLLSNNLYRYMVMLIKFLKYRNDRLKQHNESEQVLYEAGLHHSLALVHLKKF